MKQVDFADLEALVTPERVKEACAPGKYELALHMANVAASVQLVGLRRNDSEEENLIVDVYVRSNSVAGASWSVNLVVGENKLIGSCRCKGCTAPSVGQKLGKHAALALLVVSSSTRYVLTSKLNGTNRRDGAASSTNSSKSGSVTRPADARNKGEVLARGPKKLYPAPLRSQNFFVSRKVVDGIIETGGENPDWTSTKRGVIANQLRPIFHDRLYLLGAQAAVAFSGGGSIQNLRVKRPRALRSGLEWHRKFYCQAKGCLLKGVIGGMLEPTKQDEPSKFRGDYEMTVMSEGQCEHRLSEINFGFGQLRGPARSMSLKTAADDNPKKVRLTSTMVLHEQNLLRRPAYEGNCSHVGISTAVVQKVRDEVSNLHFYQQQQQQQQKQQQQRPARAPA
jgi:hypothetical protein